MSLSWLRSCKNFLALVLLAGVMPASGSGQAGQPRFKPGFNLFSRAQDVEIGKEGVAQVEKEVPLLKDPEVERYVSELGHRLVTYAPGEKDYPWTFKVVNSQEINAFALPGGFIYVNRGILEAAENEAQVAGVMAHEIGHVVMRHGTNQASKAALAQAGMSVLGGIAGQSGSLVGQLTQMGVGFGLGSIMLKYSRTAESQSDEIGTYTLYHAGYDPQAMSRFFEIVGQKYPQRTLQFFSDHPNPENRVKRVEEFIPKLGPSKAGRADSPEFQTARKRVLGLPAPPKAQPGAQPAAQPTPKPSSAPTPPPAPSSRLVVYQGSGFAIAHPDNWQVQRGKESVSMAPEGGVFRGPHDEWAQAYGASISRVVPAQNQSAKLEDVTGALIQSLQQSNPGMRVLRQKRVKVRGRRALSTQLENDSPLAGQKEIDQLVTVQGRDAVIAVVFIAPQPEYKSYQSTFQKMLNSLEIR